MKTLNHRNGLAGEYLGAAIVEDLVGDASLDLRLESVGTLAYTRDVATGEREYQRSIELLGTTVARDSKGWYAEWDYTNGGVFAGLTEFEKDTVRFGSVGLMKETAAATNGVRNPRCEGVTAGAVGSGGVLPTYWQVLNAAGLTTTVVGNGYKAGAPYVRLSLAGTISGTYALGFEASDQIVASNTQVRTTSAGIELVSGTGLLTAKAAMYERTSAGVAVSDGAAHPRTIDTRHRRLFYTRTLSGGATVARVIPAIQITGSGTISATVDIFLPQEELGSAPSSPVLPAIGTPAASTRAAETVTSALTVTRASRKTDCGGWSLASGGTFGPLTEVRAGTPAITSEGLLAEKSTTNQIRNPRCEGGSGGTAPTNWTNIGSGGLTRSYSVGYEDGWPYVDITYSGTMSSANVLGFETATQITALTGQDWTISAGARIVSGSFSGDILLYVYEINGSGGVVTSHTSAALEVDGSPRRFYHSQALTGGATTASIWPGIGLANHTGSVSFTLRVYGPQAEQKAYPTSLILPERGTLGAITRDRDHIVLDTDGWLSGNAYTILVVARMHITQNGNILSIVNAAASERVSMIATADDDLRVVITDGGAGQVDFSEASNGTTGFMDSSYALRVAANDFALSATGSAQVTDTSGTVPTDFADLGLVIANDWRQSDTFQGNGYISQIRIFPVGKTNAELETLVGN